MVSKVRVEQLLGRFFRLKLLVPWVITGSQ